MSLYNDLNEVLTPYANKIKELNGSLGDVKVDVNTLDMIIGSPVTASRTINNTSATISNTSSKVQMSAKAGETLIVNVSGTAFTKTTCYLYFFYGDSATGTSAGSVTIGQDTSIVLTDDINALGIYANSLVEGTIIITASYTPDGLYNDVDAVKKINAGILSDINDIDTSLSNAESLLYLSSSMFASYEQGKISTSTGKPTDDTNSAWIRSVDFIPVEMLIGIHKPATMKLITFYYGTDYQYLGDYVSVTDPSDITYSKQDLLDHNANVRYVKISASSRSAAETNPSDFIAAGGYGQYIVTPQEVIDGAKMSIGEQSIPSYYRSHMDSKAERINQLAKTCAGTGDVYIFITDEHWGQYNSKKSTALINYIYNNCHINRLFAGGDTDNNGNSAYCNALRSAFPGKIYHVVGNHEWFSPSDGQDLYYMMDMYNNDQIGNPVQHYYYVDNFQQSIRYIILNAFVRENGSSIVTSGYTAEQLNWLVNTALNVNAGWDIIVFTHWIGNNGAGGVEGITNFRNALDAFNRTSQSGKILAIIQGHGHYDAVFHTLGGIPIILTTCDKYLPWIDSGVDKEPWITQNRHVGTTSEQAFDVFILNRVNDTINAIRIGAKAMDNYAPYQDTTNFSPDSVLDERIVHYEKVSASGAITLTPIIDGTITWKSADETIATVADGVVTPVGSGTVVVSATNNNYQGEIWVIVV